MLTAGHHSHRGLLQRCWAHKIRNVRAKVRHADQPAVRTDLLAVINADTVPQARSAARRVAARWDHHYLKAVACLLDRILFAVFNHENQNQGVSTPLLLTQTFLRYPGRGLLRRRE